MQSLWLGAVCGVTFGLISTHASAQADRLLARDGFVRAVLAANPSVEAARQGWRAALARVRQAGAFDDPMVDVSAAPLSIGSSHARFGYEVGIRQQLPWFGKRALERDVMVAEAAASASDLETTRRELAMTAVLLYDEYYVTSRSLEINAQHVALLQSLRAAATAQLETGRGSTHDALQAEAELTHLERDAAMLEADRDVVASQMNELLHRRSDAPLPPPVRELNTRDGPPRANAKQLEQDAISHRSEIAAARSHARAQIAKAQAAAREQYPSISVSTSYSSMWDMPEHRWMVGVGLNVPWPNEQRGRAHA
jgi:cobalt-zinc-cadmium efflux system outer membrane protein